MTYVVGGTPRSGKSALRMLFLEKYKIPGFCTDYLRDAFEYEVPSFGIKRDMTDRQKAEILWPYFRGILNQRQKNYRDDLFIEGTNFLPEYLKENLGDEHTRIVFLGYTGISVEEKFRNIRNLPSQHVEWTGDMDDSELKASVEQFIDLSKYFKSECAKHG